MRDECNKMEGNKDEAKKCLEIARRSKAEGDKEKAKKFLKKSLKLFPFKETEILIKELEEEDSGTDSQMNKSMPCPKAKANPPSEEKKKAEYTPEQLADVKRISKLKDYYEILGVTKDASDGELRKAYKKLALQFHPDKNKAPGSTEAFKAIGNSFAILSDPEKRKKYDLYGPESLVNNRNHNNHFHHNEFEADITPEDLFNMFFGGMAGNQVFIHRRHHRRRQHHHDEEDGHHESGIGSIFHLIPILIFLGLSLITSLLIQDPPYSFSISGPYRLHRVTSKYKISYYVQRDFTNNYHGKSLAELEYKIEKEYVGRIRSACYRQQQTREELLARARFWNDEDLYYRAQKMSMESCDELDRLRNR